MTETVISGSASARAGQRGVTQPLDLFSVAVATAGLIFLAPLMLVIALPIFLGDGGSPVFAQRRVGYGGRPFRCLKFRTMAVDADRRLEALLASDPSARFEWQATQKLRNDPRVTRVGEFLRKSSLDELPQLINVIRGDMSLVGPRPIVPPEISRYGVHFRHYRSVRPGMTGLWQVSGRNDVSYRERVVFDVAYARYRSFSLDLSILLRTIPAVVQTKGAR